MPPRRKVFKITSIVILIFLAAFVFYFPSYSRYRELKSEAQKLEADLAELQKQIVALQHEKQLLKNDKAYLETVIRKELGLVEPGEVVYEFEDKPRRKAPVIPGDPAPETPSKTADSKAKQA